MKKDLEIGSRINWLREDNDLSKSELARKCGVTTTAVWNWEKNGIVPRFETFELLAKALGVSATFLRTGVDEPAPEPTSLPTRTVAVIIDEARNEIAAITGVPINNVRLNVEFLSH